VNASKLVGVIFSPRGAILATPGPMPAGSAGAATALASAVRVGGRFPLLGRRPGLGRSGAPSSNRLRATLAVLALVLTAFAATAASASAAPTLGAKMEGVSNVSYTSAHVTGHVSTPGSANAFFGTTVTFQYSTDQVHWTPGPVENFTLSAEERFVQGDITGLKGGTTYYVRISVFTYPNEAFSPAPYLSFTTLPVEPPTVSLINDASEVFSRSATATGKVKRPANSESAFNVTACRFEYVTDAQFTATNFQGAATQGCEFFTAITAPGGEEEVSAELQGLSPSTTYHLRLAAENAAPTATTKEATHTFTTSPLPAKPSIVSIEDAVVLPPFNAKFKGVIERPAGGDPALNVTCRFEYITDAKFKENEAHSLPGFEGATQERCIAPNPLENPIETAGPTTVTAEPTVLVPSTTYHLRLVAENFGGTTSKEAAHTFTSVPAEKPIITINPVVSGAYTTAKVSGTLEAPPGHTGRGLEFVLLEISTDGVHWEAAVGGIEGSQVGVIPVEHEFTNLHPSTTYFFRISAYYYYGFGNQEVEERGEMGRSPEPNPSVTTLPVPAPTVNFAPVSGVTSNSAHFTATIETNAPPGPLTQHGKEAFKTEWHFECTPECPATPALSGVIEGEESIHHISVDAIRLETNTFYEEVKLVASNAVHTVTSPAQTFQTPLILPTVKASAGGSAGEGSYNVGGIVTPFNSKISNCHFEYGPTTEYVYSAPCTPDPVGRNEIQKIYIGGLEGQFKLVFRGQTTEDINQSAPAAVVESELKALSAIGPEGVTEVEIEGGFFATGYIIHFSGPLSSQNVGLLRSVPGTIPLHNEPGGATLPEATGPALTIIEGGNNAPVLVEAHLTGLTPGATYHYKLVATNVLGTVSSGDNTFVPPLAANEAACPNEKQREENSSTRLPECRAYELVTSAPKGGFSASLYQSAENESVAYQSIAGNIEGSGQGFLFNLYVAQRTDGGWETLRNLNGPRGSLFAPPFDILGAQLGQYSPDLRSSIWKASKPGTAATMYLREPNGEFAQMNNPPAHEGGLGLYISASPDLSHTYWYGQEYANELPAWAPGVGQGIYEFVGTGNTGIPRRIDLDNAGNALSECSSGSFIEGATTFDTANTDGKTVFFTIKACEGHPAELFARVDASKTYFISESQCTRTASDPGGACNAPAEGVYWYNGESSYGTPIGESVSATPDGSHFAFTTTQQLVNGDTNQSADLYLYDLPTASNPSPSLIDVSGSGPNAQVEQLIRVSDDGNTIYFVAKGVLASNHDAFDEPPHDGDKNVYVWHRDASDPEGQTKFIGKLTANSGISGELTPGDGRYLAFRTTSQLLPTDTDNAADIYRYDDVTGELVRVSVDAAGTGGNEDNLSVDEFPRQASGPTLSKIVPGGQHPAMSDNGAEIVFTTSEALSADDGNGAPDVYIWKDGHTSLISTGSVGGGANSAFIDGTGKDIYFSSGQQLTPNDTDSVGDVYDAREKGGFSFVRHEACTGEACQPSQSGRNSVATPGSQQSKARGNYQRATVSVKALSSSQLAKLVAGGKIGLGVKVSGGGKISVKGTTLIHGKQLAVIAASSRAVQAGLVTLPISLSKSGQAQLRSKGSLEVNLSVAFADSEPASSVLKLKMAEPGRKHSKKGNG
jgi:hypothetical protein